MLCENFSLSRGPYSPHACAHTWLSLAVLPSPCVSEEEVTAALSPAREPVLLHSIPHPAPLTSPGLEASASEFCPPPPGWSHTFALQCLLEAQLVGKRSISSPLSESTAGKTRLLGCVLEATP